MNEITDEKKQVDDRWFIGAFIAVNWLGGLALLWLSGSAPLVFLAFVLGGNTIGGLAMWVMRTR